MATIRERIEKELFNHGLWPEEAKAIVKEMETQDLQETKTMKDRWDEAEEGYPKVVLAVLLLSAKTQAVQWIDKNKPRHFARYILTN